MDDFFDFVFESFESRLKPEDNAHRQKNGQGDDQEIDDRLDEVAIREQHRALACHEFAGRFVEYGRAAKHDIEAFDIDSGNQSDQRHDDVGDQTLDDCVKRGPDHDADSEIDGIALGNKGSEILEKLSHRIPFFRFNVFMIVQLKANVNGSANSLMESMETIV